MGTRLQNEVLVDFVFCFSGWRVKATFPDGYIGFIGPERGYQNPEYARQVATNYAIENNFDLAFSAGQSTDELVKIKTRNYDLKQGSNVPVYDDVRSRPVNAAEPAPSVDGREDYIPHHNKPGDEVTLTIDGLKWAGIVKAAKGSLVLLHSEFLDEWAINNFATGESHILDDSARCPQCGDFFCTCHQHDGIDSTVTTNPTNPKDMNAVTVKELMSYSDKQSIECLEGRIPSVFKRKTGVSNGHEWSMHDAALKDREGNETRITFTNRNEDEVAALKGKMVRITPAIGTNGSKGLYYSISESKGKTYKGVRCTEDCTIELLGSGGEPKPQGSGSSSSSSGSSSAPSGGGGRSYQNELDPAEQYAGIPVEKRAAEYFRVYGAVHKAYDEADLGEGAELSNSDLKDITTGILLSFRGKYGSYHPVLFEGETPPPPTPAKGSLPNWKECVHPRRGVKLSEIPDEELLDMVAWALTTHVKEDAKEARLIQANLIAAAHEKQWSVRVCALTLLTRAMEDGHYEDQDVTAYLNQTFGIEGGFKGLNEEQQITLLKSLAKDKTGPRPAIKAITELAEARQQSEGSGDDEIPD